MDKCSTYQKKKTYRRLKGVENPFISDSYMINCHFHTSFVQM